MKPLKTLGFVVGVLFLLSLAMFFTPAKGIKIGGFTFHMPTFHEMIEDDQEDYANVSDIIENIGEGYNYIRE